MTDSPPNDESPQTLSAQGQELWELVVAYARQETLDPLRGLGRYIGLGLGGSVLVGIGTILMATAGLRLLQTETGSRFTGNWSWAPYLIVLIGALTVAGIALYAIGRERRRADSHRPTLQGEPQ